MERPVISTPILLDAAHTAEPTAKVTTATSKMIFRPQISESLAQTGVAAAVDNRYADPIHV